MRRIFDFRRCFSGQVGYTVLCLIIIPQKWTAFACGSTFLHQTFIEPVSNYYTHKKHASCDCVFLCIFIHYYCLNCCISTKLSPIYVILICQHDRYDCRLWRALQCKLVLVNFNDWFVISSSSFNKFCEPMLPLFLWLPKKVLDQMDHI